jgi:hypothetical protein
MWCSPMTRGRGECGARHRHTDKDTERREPWRRTPRAVEPSRAATGPCSSPAGPAARHHATSHTCHCEERGTLHATCAGGVGDRTRHHAQRATHRQLRTRDRIAQCKPQRARTLTMHMKMASVAATWAAAAAQRPNRRNRNRQQQHAHSVDSTPTGPHVVRRATVQLNMQHRTAMMRRTAVLFGFALMLVIASARVFSQDDRGSSRRPERLPHSSGSTLRAMENALGPSAISVHSRQKTSDITDETRDNQHSLCGLVSRGSSDVLAEAVLEASGQRAHVSHAASALHFSALRLLAPVVCKRTPHNQ